MSNIIIISSTHRINSNSLKISRLYEDFLKSKNVLVKVLDLCQLPSDFHNTDMFDKRSDKFASIIDEYISNNSKFIFVVPEYNGSFPGIIKTFIDCLPQKSFENKKGCLVGIANGRAGNILGLEHLSSVLQYLKMNVYYNKLPISSLKTVLSPDGRFSSDSQKAACESQLEGFLNF